MAGRRKVAGGGENDGGRAFAVVVEQLRGDFRVFGEALGGLTEKVDGLSARVDGLSERVDGLSERVDGLSERVDGLEAKMDRRFDSLEVDVGLMKAAILAQGRELTKKVDRDEVEGIVERAVARAVMRG